MATGTGFFSRVRARFSRRAPSPPAVAPLLVLPAGERDRVQAVERILRDEELRLQLLKTGRAVLWKQLQETHRLPTEFDYNYETGEVLPKQR